MLNSISPIPTFKDNYIWAIHNNHCVAIIDPGNAESVLQFLTSYHLSPAAILITHHHWDHTNGIAELKEKFSIPIYSPANEAITTNAINLTEDDQISLPELNVSLRILDIPGHTRGHIAYYNNEVLFCGDTLFSAGCGRLFEGTAAQMYASLQKLKSLADTTKVYCAHEYTLANLRFAQTVEPSNQAILIHADKVAALRSRGLPSLPSSIEIMANAARYAGKTLANEVEVFQTLREWKDRF